MKSEHDKTMLCPCRSGKQYEVCCQPFHQGKKPDTALQLMRSRFAAYALCMPDYIIHTTHPANPQFCHDTGKWSQKISEFSLHTEFKDLSILEFQENVPLLQSLLWLILFKIKKMFRLLKKATLKK